MLLIRATPKAVYAVRLPRAGGLSSRQRPHLWPVWGPPCEQVCVEKMMQLEELRRHAEEQKRNSIQQGGTNSGAGGQLSAASNSSQRGADEGPQGVSAVPTSSDTITIKAPGDIAVGEATPVKTNGISKGGSAEMLEVVKSDVDLATMSQEERTLFVEKRKKEMHDQRVSDLQEAQNVSLVLSHEEKTQLTPIQVDARNRKKVFRYRHHWAEFVSSFRQSKALQKFLEREPADKDSPEHTKWVVATYVGHPYCTMIITFLVCFNSSLTGLYADQRLGEDTLRYLILCFLFIFSVEICLKIYAFGQRRYFSDGWNVLDFSVVCIAILEVSINYVGPSIGIENDALTSALRIVGIFRIARLFAALKELEFVVRAFVISMGSAFWVNVLTLLCLFILSLLGRLTFGDHPELNDKTAYHDHGSGANASELFGTVLRGMATMFQVMTMNWAVPTRIVSEYHAFGWFYFSFAMVFTGLGVYNLYTAIYVEKMREITEAAHAKSDSRKLKRRKELMLEVGDLMNVIDTDRSGTLDRLEMEEGLTLLGNIVRLPPALDPNSNPYASVL